MRLFIAEKPELGRAIAEAIGVSSRGDGFITCINGDIISWCFGHLLQLTDPEDHDPSAKQWNMSDLPLQWPVSHKPIHGKTKQINLIKSLSSKADEIIHAGDPDDEGQLLVDELLDYIGNTKPVRRILINDLNKTLVLKALDNLRDNKEFYGLYQSALARSIADQLYGYNMTRGYTLAAREKGSDAVLSVGRVQTPILGLIVNRDKSHEDHKSSFYYTLQAEISAEQNQFRARYIPSETAPLDDKGRVIDEDFLNKIAQSIEGKAPTISSIVSEEKEQAAPLPYNLLMLQADASNLFSFSPDKTLKITQSLRENHKLITYNRSDCQYLSDEQHNDAPAVLDAVLKTAHYLSDYIKAADPALKSRAFNSKNVSAHHAIIPTQTAKDISSLSPEEAKIYMLIARGYITQFMPKYRYREIIVNLNIEGHAFKATSKIELQSGWKDAFKNDAIDDGNINEEEEDQSSIDLSWLKEQSNLICTAPHLDKKKTAPPPYYTMAALLKDLTRVSKFVRDPKIKQLLMDKDKDKKGEHGGIGTPATRSAIIAQLIERGFIIEKGKKVISTPLGREFCTILPEIATVPDMTAYWHEQQEDIKTGQLTINQFISEVFSFISDEITNLKTSGINISIEDAISCPTCNAGHLKRRKGRNGHFWGCNKYPDCKVTFPDKRGKPDLSEKTPLKTEASDTHSCPKCEAGLIRRPAKKKGSFWWGCSSFPVCDFRAFDKDGKPVINN